jgi:hypothetical protein
MESARPTVGQKRYLSLRGVIPVMAQKRERKQYLSLSPEDFSPGTVCNSNKKNTKNLRQWDDYIR